MPAQETLGLDVWDPWAFFKLLDTDGGPAPGGFRDLSSCIFTKKMKAVGSVKAHSFFWVLAVRCVLCNLSWSKCASWLRRANVLLVLPMRDQLGTWALVLQVGASKLKNFFLDVCASVAKHVLWMWEKSSRSCFRAMGKHFFSKFPSISNCSGKVVGPDQSHVFFYPGHSKNMLLSILGSQITHKCWSALAASNHLLKRTNPGWWKIRVETWLSRQMPP